MNANFSFRYKVGSTYFNGQEKAIDFLIKEVNKIGKEMVIVAGDFNFEPGSTLHRKFIELTGVEDVVPENLNTFLGGLLYLPSRGGRRPDHIFTRNTPGKKPSRVEILWEDPIKDVGLLSDHAGILATIEI